MRILIVISVLFSLNTNAEEFLPKPLLMLNDFFSHHVIVAEKSTHSLYLYNNEESYPKLVKKFQMATGKKAGNKIYQGDHRTPEGIYHFTEFLTHQELLSRHGKAGEIYGVGAFVMNYPNPIDRKAGKTGGGIWLHSTNDETRIDKGLDSRGCIVAHNKNLIDISEYIELNKTNIVVVHELNFLSKTAWNAEREKISNTVKSWLKSWQDEDIKAYTSFYHKKNYFDRRRKNWHGLKQYKSAVFANPGKPDIQMHDLTIMSLENYTVVTFTQDYKSNTIRDIGKKTLYLQKDQYYNWRIVSENWTKAGIDNEEATETFAFKPSMRFFDSKDPRRVFTKNINLTQPETSKN